MIKNENFLPLKIGEIRLSHLQQYIVYNRKQEIEAVTAKLSEWCEMCIYHIWWTFSSGVNMKA